MIDKYKIVHPSRITEVLVLDLKSTVGCNQLSFKRLFPRQLQGERYGSFQDKWKLKNLEDGKDEN